MRKAHTPRVAPYLFLAAMLSQPNVLNLTDEISTYMKAYAEAANCNQPEPVPHPDHWGLAMLTDCQLAVKIVMRARRNRCKLLWLILYF